MPMIHRSTLLLVAFGVSVACGLLAVWGLFSKPAQDFAAAGLGARTVDRVLMNPPFHDLRRQNVSPDPRRRLAHAGQQNLLPRWVATAAWLLKPQGVLTLIWRADALDDVLAALARDFGDVAVLPVLPRPQASAIRVLVRAVLGARGAPRDFPALVLNDEAGRPTSAAEAVLRAGETLGVTGT